MIYFSKNSSKAEICPRVMLQIQWPVFTRYYMYVYNVKLCVVIVITVVHVIEHNVLIQFVIEHIFVANFNVFVRET